MLNSLGVGLNKNVALPPFATVWLATVPSVLLCSTTLKYLPTRLGATTSEAVPVLVYENAPLVSVYTVALPTTTLAYGMPRMTSALHASARKSVVTYSFTWPVTVLW